MLDSRAAWIDPRARRRREEEKLEERRHRAPSTCEARRRGEAEHRGDATRVFVRESSTPRDGTASVSGAPRSPTIEKETEPNGDLKRPRDDPSARRLESKRHHTPPPETRRLGAVSASSFVSAPSHSPSPSVVSRPEPIGVTFARVVPATPPLDIEPRIVRGRHQRRFGSDWRARWVPATSTRRGSSLHAAECESPSGVDENAGDPRRGRPYFRCRGRPYSRCLGRPTPGVGGAAPRAVAHVPPAIAETWTRHALVVSSVSGRTSVHQI